MKNLVKPISAEYSDTFLDPYSSEPPIKKYLRTD